MSDARVEAWVRGRFVPLPQARLFPIRANAWTVRLPTDAATAKALRVRRMSARELDDLVLAVDGEEAAQVLVSTEGDGWIELAVLR